MKKRVVCAMLAAMMVFSTATPTLAGDVAVDGTSDSNGGTITTATEKKEPVYKVSVPTNLKVYIDPFEQLGADASITSEEFAFINKSDVAIKLDTTITLIGGTGVTLKADSNDVDEDDTSKLAAVSIEIPDEVTEIEEDGAKFVAKEDWTTQLTVYKGTSATADYYLTKDNNVNVTNESEVTDEMLDVRKAKATDYDSSTIVELDPTKETTLSFALAKAQYVDVYETYDDDSDVKYNVFKTTAEDEAGTAVFRFSGVVNTKADWQSSDIKTKVTYSFIGMTDDNYDEAMGDEDGHAYFGFNEEDVTAVTTPSASATSIQNNGGTVDITLPEGVTVSEYQKLKTDGTYNTIPTTYYTVTDIDNGVQLKLADLLGKYPVATSIKIVFSDESSITLSVTK